MKKIYVLCAIVCAGAAHAGDRDTYAGARMHKNAHIAYKYNGDFTTTMKDDNFGFGAFVGNRLTDNVRIEFETSYTGAEFERYNAGFDYDIWSNMLNVYLFREYGNAVAPYVGAGAGFSQIWATANHSHDDKSTISYQIMGGVTFALNDRIDLDIGVKYQNHGKISHRGATTKIDATEFYIGGAYKFGLR